MRELLRGRASAGLFLASLIMNIFLLGMVAAPHLFNPPPPPPLSPPPPRIMVERMADALSESGRAMMLRKFDATSENLERLFQELMKTQSDLMREFANESFDEMAYRRGLDSRKQAADAFFSAMSSFFMSVGPELSVADRRSIVERGRI